jgi:peptide chain release factor subunit 1
MISLVIPPKGQVNLVQKMLVEEMGTATNIKSRVNRQSVLDAIGSAQQRLKLYTKVPPNGLVVYCGAVLTETGKERQMRIDFEPFKPINTSLYMCDNKFHTQALSDLLVNDDKYGFVVMDGNGTLFGTVCGNHREILQKITVDLPKKHGRGGQSALRFARLRLEKRQNYLTKVAELTTQHFISNDKPNVAGLVLAGSADFKNRLAEADCFDQRLQAVTLAVVDVSYGGENGFNQAIELSADTLSSLKFVQEKKLVGRFFDEIAQDTGKYVFGINDTLTCLEMGACETLVCWENLEVMRVILKNPQTEEEIIKHLRPEEMGDGNDHVRDKEGNDLEVVDSQPLLEWLANEYKKFGCILEIISDKSQEGNQFCRGFGGIGGLLRYQVDLSTFEVPEDADSDDWDSDDSECFI